MLTAARKRYPKRWSDIDDLFMAGVRAVQAMDVARPVDDRHRTLGRIFGGLLTLVLEGCSGVAMITPSEVPGLTIPVHSASAASWSVGALGPALVLDATVVGVSARAPWAVHPSTEVELRSVVSETGFKAIDVKSENQRLQSRTRGMLGPAGGDLTSWLRSRPPSTCLCVAARIEDGSDDLVRVVDLCDQATLLHDVVGLVAFTSDPRRPRTARHSLRIPSHLRLDGALGRIGVDLLAAIQLCGNP